MLVISVILTFGFSVSLQSLLAAWIAPMNNPPSNNVGDLIIGGSLGVGANVGIDGKIGVGTAITSTAKMIMKSANSEEGLKIISSDYSPLVIRNTNNTSDLFRVKEDGRVCIGIDCRIAWPVSGTTYTAGTGISISGSTIVNSGDTNAADDITSLVAGTGVAISGTGNSRTISVSGGVTMANFLVNFQHFDVNCTGLGGTIVNSAGNNFCKLASLPVGWTQYLSWTQTTPKTCVNSTYTASCTTGSHAWSNAAIEMCTYCTRSPASGCGGFLFCYANVAQRGIY